MLGGLTPEEDAIIDRAITETYALKDITGDLTSRRGAAAAFDFENVLSGMEGAQSSCSAFRNTRAAPGPAS
jgi:conjugal transfer ATP-binding protein TraC